MRSTVARGVKGLARGTHSLVSQVAVSVATALAVAFITGATLGGGDDAAQKPNPATELAGARAPGTAANAYAAAEPLPPLEVEIIADVPSAPASPEIFPGVPADMPATTLKATAEVAKRSEPARRRFLGIPLPFGDPAAASPAAAAIDTAVRGG